MPVERLQEDLWEGELPASAASTLKSHISLLRRALGANRLTYRDGAYVLLVGSDELDVLLFERDAAEGRSRLGAGDLRDAIVSFGRGLGMWRGPALADVADTSWGEPEAVRLEELRADVTEWWLEARLALGEALDVAAAAEAAVAEHPLREGMWAKLMTALYLSGRQADALRAYQRLRELLAEELGITPSPELVALEGQILRQELKPSRTEILQPVGLDGVVASKTNLPVEPTSFVPRPIELAAVAALLEERGLVTLTGGGGTGKTRLAIELAREMTVRYDGVWMCELAGVNDPADVVRELASSLGCQDQPGVELSATIARQLGEGSQLVILDNCEHILSATAELAHYLLRSLPRIRLLATSRSPLGVSGEVLHRVPSMSLPTDRTSPDELLNCEAIRLFVERARAQQPDFKLGEANGEAVASICVRLDGIPLAIELAAARTRTLSVVEIERRLEDRFKLLTTGARPAPPRQRTLKALFDWSYDLLENREQISLARLAVCAGGFDVTTAESIAVCQEVQARDVLDVVSSLVDKSLLQVDISGGDARYRMLETVRDYATATAADTELHDARMAHALHFLALIESCAPQLAGPSQLIWRARLEADEDNLRSAFSALIAEPGRAEEALRFGAAVSRFWNSRGYYGDEVDVLQAALARPDAVRSTTSRAAALAAAGYLMFRTGDTARAQRHLEEALAIGRDLDSPSLMADALRTTAWLAARRGDDAEGTRLAEEALTAARESEDGHLIARALDVRAATRQHVDPAGARADFAEAIRYCRASGDGLGQASALNNLAVLELEEGRHQAARSHFTQALGIAESVRDAALLPFLEYGVGLAAELDDDHAGAEQAFRSALTAARRTGQRSLVAYTLLGLAVTAVATHNDARAMALLGASSSLFEELAEEPERIEAGLRDRALAHLAGQYGPALEGALADGRVLSAAEAEELVTGGL